MDQQDLSITKAPGGFRILFPRSLKNLGEVLKLEILGTFTGWEPQEIFEKDQKYWNAFLSDQGIGVPGNTGFPEFTFRVNGQFWYGYDFYLPAKHVLHKRLIALVWGEEENARWLAMQGAVNRWDKDLRDPIAMANFREVVPKVLGGTLIRSYHPFFPSKLGHPQEQQRLKSVNDLVVRHEPGSVINLSDSPEDLRTVQLPGIYEYLLDRNHVGFFQTDYEVVYYRSDSKIFSQTLLRILEFIDEHPGPFWIHCRLGVDRTGVFSAFLAAFAGAVWEEIAQDYELSNAMGLLEYRNRALLGHSLSRFLGRDVSSILGPLFEPLTQALEHRLGMRVQDLVQRVRNKLIGRAK